MGNQAVSESSHPEPEKKSQNGHPEGEKDLEVEGGDPRLTVLEAGYCQSVSPNPGSSGGYPEVDGPRVQKTVQEAVRAEGSTPRKAAQNDTIQEGVHDGNEVQPSAWKVAGQDEDKQAGENEDEQAGEDKDEQTGQGRAGRTGRGEAGPDSADTSGVDKAEPARAKASGIDESGPDGSMATAGNETGGGAAGNGVGAADGGAGGGGKLQKYQAQEVSAICCQVGVKGQRERKDILWRRARD
ncbi:hypothetical protein ACER0C_001151 [Sarotherodon galilaeus]